jgi:shikimate kinase
VRVAREAQLSLPNVAQVGYFIPVQAPRNIRNLALIGFMGTGKSSVGRALAGYFNFEFVDTDELIVQRAGKPITDIFAQDGEPAFRGLEGQIVAELAQRKDCVISTGGGLGANAEHLAALKEHALTVCLWASPETIFERVRHSSHRPLLNEADPLARIRELLAQRESVYKQADLLIGTELRQIKEVVHQIVIHFEQVRRAAGK